MEFPTNPSRRQRRQQQEVALAIAGMQDVYLEPTPDRLEELLETAYDLPLVEVELVDVDKLRGADGPVGGLI